MDLKNILTPEIQNSIETFSNKMQKEMAENKEMTAQQAAQHAVQETATSTTPSTSEANPAGATYGQGLGNILNAFQTILQDDPQIVDRTLQTIQSNGIFNGASPAGGIVSDLMGQFMNGGGGGAVTNENEEENSLALENSMEEHIEKQVILPATLEEVEQQKKKKFRIRLHSDEPDKKTMFELQLERNTFAYSFFYHEVQPPILIRVAIKLPDSDTVSVGDIDITV